MYISFKFTKSNNKMCDVYTHFQLLFFVTKFHLAVFWIQCGLCAQFDGKQVQTL